MNELTPRTNTKLVGHNEAEATLMHDLVRGKLAHGWIISGPQGIGKATLAYRFARTLLSGEADLHEDHPIFKRIVAGSHSDLLVLEQLFDEKKDEKTKDISVEQAREIGQFLSLTPGESQWRVVIIDSADALNANGANAILKILEEPPPQTILLLIAHNVSRLLPTIRSRCRVLKLKPLNDKQFVSVVRNTAPELDSVQIRALGQLCENSPGMALEMHAHNGLEIYHQILEILSSLPSLDMALIHTFADRLLGNRQHTNWLTFMQLMLSLLARVTFYAEGVEIDAVAENELAVLRALGSLHPAMVWAGKWQQVAEQFSLAQRLYLDYKQIIIIFFHSLITPEGLQMGVAA